MLIFFQCSLSLCRHVREGGGREEVLTGQEERCGLALDVKVNELSCVDGMAG